MKQIIVSTCAALALAASLSAFAMDDMKKDSTGKDGMMKRDAMTMQECKDHMAMQKDGMKKDDAMMKKDAMCADMMKKNGMSADGMSKSGASMDTMKK